VALTREGLGEPQEAPGVRAGGARGGLEVRDLEVAIADGPRTLHPLQGVRLDVPAGGMVGLVGESGSGKSLTAAAVLQLLPETARVTGGSIDFQGTDLLALGERQMQAVRGARVSMVFQNPRASLNPVLTVGGQIAELLRIHEGESRRSSRERAVALLDAMGIADAPRRARDYPHQYSGGMAQRAGLARAMACSPDLLIADEPTSGLDVTLQQEVLQLLARQVRSRGASLLLITHDIGVVAAICDTVAVMYAGIVVEQGPTALVLGRPTSPYTRELVACFRAEPGARMHAIPGQVPLALAPHRGCPFRDRCPLAAAECAESVPRLREVDGRLVACHRV
jgi:oligopeptide/dipeptide ABC transporter ATP-binding protein